MGPSWICALSLVLASAPVAWHFSDREDSAELAACPRCNDAREVACVACAKTTCKWEGEGKTKAKWCSEAVACQACAGTRRAACGACNGALPEATRKLHAEA